MKQSFNFSSMKITLFSFFLFCNVLVAQQLAPPPPPPCNSETIWSISGWSNGLPDQDKRAIFEVNFSSSVNLLAPNNMIACEVIVQNNANVTFNSGHILKVIHNVQVVIGSTLTFENNASLVQVNNAAINLGKITY